MTIYKKLLNFDLKTKLFLRASCFLFVLLSAS